MALHSSTAHRAPCFRCECGDFHDAYEESNDLAQFIHTEGITCLNESVAGACQQVFCPEGQRRAGEDIALRSDEDDPELVRGAQNATRPLSRGRAPHLDANPYTLQRGRAPHRPQPGTAAPPPAPRPAQLIHVSFHVAVKVSSLIIVGEPGSSAPAHVRAFVNQDGIDFSDAGRLPPAQEWDLADAATARLEYPTLRAKFQNVSSITLHVTANHGGEVEPCATCIRYIAFKGEGTKNRRGIVDAMYEVRPVPKTTEVPGEGAAAAEGF